MTKETLWNGISLQSAEGVFPLGTDSFLLADFARPKKGAAIADLCCGGGAVGMMLLANDPTANLLGVELQAQAADLARLNAEENGFADRFTVVHGDVREIRSLIPANGYTLVTANPPYFPANNLSPQSDAMALARTESACPPDALCAAAAWLLQTGGKFCLVHRPERLAELIFALKSHKLEPKRLQFVRHKKDSRRSLLLLEATLEGSSGLTLEEDLILYCDDGTETEACRRIYHR